MLVSVDMNDAHAGQASLCPLPAMMPRSIAGWRSIISEGAQQGAKGRPDRRAHAKVGGHTRFKL